jgi:hypothetical protein
MLNTVLAYTAASILSTVEALASEFLRRVNAQFVAGWQLVEGHG